MWTAAHGGAGSDGPRLRLFALGVLAALSCAPLCYGEQQGPRDLLTDRLARGRVPRLSTDEPRNHFQVTVRWRVPEGVAGAAPMDVRLVCEAKGRDIAMLFSDKEGLPFAFYGSRLALLLSREHGGFVRVRKASGSLICGDGAPSPSLTLAPSDRADGGVVIDFEGLCRKFLERDPEVEFSRVNQAFLLKSPTGSTAEVRFSREKGRGAHPIASVRMTNADGSGFTISDPRVDARICPSLFEFEEAALASKVAREAPFFEGVVAPAQLLLF